MKVKFNYVSKENVVSARDSETIGQVFRKLKESGFRAIPVIDESNRFSGIIYKVHIYEHLYENGGSESTLVSALVKNANDFISENCSFSKIFCRLEQVPFMGVVDEKGDFAGIITHSNVMRLHADSLGIEPGQHSVTVGVRDGDGVLLEMLTLLRKEKVSVQSLTTGGMGDPYRTISFSLSKDTTEEQMKRVFECLESNFYRVTDYEVIQFE